MSANLESGWLRDGVLRAVVWGGAAALFLLPVIVKALVELPWTGEDFVAWAIMLGTVAGIFELGMRVSRSHFYRAATAIAAGAAFLVVWVHLAVQIIDVENDAAMLMFFAPLVIGVVGAALARFRAAGMAMTLFVMVIAQLVIAVLAWVASPGQPEGWAFSGCIAAAWLASAQLYRIAARA